MTSTTGPEPAARPHLGGGGGARRALPAASRIAAVTVFWLAVWQLVAVAVGRDFLLASPLSVAARLVELVPTADFWATVAHTLARVAVGFALAAVLGLALAVAAAWSRLVEALVGPLMAAVRAAPVVSFIILLLLWLDAGQLAAATALLMALPVMYVGLLAGIRARDRELLEMARVFRFPWTRRVATIDAPAVVPYAAAASRTAIGLAWKAGVAAEVIGVVAGSIGAEMYDAKLFLSSADLLAWTVVVVVVSVACERLVVAALRALPGGRGPAPAGGAS